MTLDEMRTRVTAESAVAVVALAAVAAWIGGAVAALGMLAGGALAIGNFRSLAARVAALGSADGAGARGFLLGFGLRFATLAVACGVLLATGRAHPVALLAGLTVVPLTVLARGLHVALRES